MSIFYLCQASKVNWSNPSSLSKFGTGLISIRHYPVADSVSIRNIALDFNLAPFYASSSAGTPSVYQHFAAICTREKDRKVLLLLTGRHDWVIWRQSEVRESLQDADDGVGRFRQRKVL